MKNSEIGAGAKVPHLSYLGDADVGEGANIAAGNITANYDGFDKHRTKIGKSVKTGVDTSFVAPVSVGDGAYTGAGSVIAEDVPDGALGIARPEAEEHRGIRGAQGEAARMSTVDTTQAAPAVGSYIPAEYDKRLMVAAGRASQELGAKIAERLRSG